MSGSIEQRGVLLTSVLEFVKNGVEPEFSDLALTVAFSVIRNTIKRDLEKYEKVCKVKSENAKKRWTVNANECNSMQIDAFAGDNDTDNVNDIDNVNDTDNDNVNEADKKIKSTSFSSKTACVYSEEFLSFWKEYPKKVGKGEAFKQWKKARLTENDMLEILNALKWQKKSDRWCNSNGRYIPNPATYLSQRRWEDEPFDVIGDITNPSRYTDGDDLPDYILKGDF